MFEMIKCLVLGGLSFYVLLIFVAIIYTTIYGLPPDDDIDKLTKDIIDRREDKS